MRVRDLKEILAGVRDDVEIHLAIPVEDEDGKILDETYGEPTFDYAGGSQAVLRPA